MTDRIVTRWYLLQSIADMSSLSDKDALGLFEINIELKLAHSEEIIREKHNCTYLHRIVPSSEQNS